ncbi:MAG: hypothetical protein WAM97_05550 [Acidimicrobiales bacterium]
MSTLASPQISTGGVPGAPPPEPDVVVVVGPVVVVVVGSVVVVVVGAVVVVVVGSVVVVVVGSVVVVVVDPPADGVSAIVAATGRLPFD